jgi:hypothetical protein
VCIRLGEKISVGHLDHALATPILGKKIAIFAKNGLFQTDFSPFRKRFRSNLRESSAKENRLSFPNIYRKSRLSLSVTEISRDKDTRFFRVQNLKLQNRGNLSWSS